MNRILQAGVVLLLLTVAVFVGVKILEAPVGKSLSDQAAQVSDVVDRMLFQRYGDALAMALKLKTVPIKTDRPDAFDLCLARPVQHS